MGSVYTRGSTLWIAYQDAAGKRLCRSSGYKVGQESQANALLDEMERRARDAKPATKSTDGTPSSSRPGPAPVAPEQLPSED